MEFSSAVVHGLARSGSDTEFMVMNVQAGY